MKARVVIRLKDEIVDAPGNALVDQLVSLGFSEVKKARIGKLIEFDIQSADRNASLERIDKMCQDLLANQAAEDYEIESLES